MRFFNHTAPDLPTNLAIDEALLQQTEELDLGPTLRIWEAGSLAIVLGASGKVAEDVQLAACQADKVPLGRRSSGGGTVVIGPGALNLAVILPTSYAPGLTAVDTAQAFVLEQLAATLRRSHQLHVQLQGSGDLTLHNRKFAGSAQRRLKRHFLVHTSLLYHFDLPLISRYTRLPRRQPDYRQSRDHDSFLTNLPLSREDLIQSIREAWYAPATSPDQPTANLPLVLVDHLLATKFADPAWTLRF